jgi:hypothetical protein
MKDLLDRNKAGAFLQPWERGLLKLVKYLLVAAVAFRPARDLHVRAEPDRHPIRRGLIGRRR